MLLRAFGGKPELIGWLQTDLPLEVAALWASAGFEPGEACFLIEAGFDSPCVPAIYRDQGLWEKQIVDARRAWLRMHPLPEPLPYPDYEATALIQELTGVQNLMGSARTACDDPSPQLVMQELQSVLGLGFEEIRRQASESASSPKLATRKEVVL